MYDVQRKVLRDGIHQLHLRDAGESLTYEEVLARWQGEAAFRSFFTALLADAPFSAYRWETPPVTSATLDRPFECVLADDPALDLPPDPTPFAEYFDADPPVAVFDNLGRDAVLLAPAPRGPESEYVHLAAFSRGAPENQQHALWQRVGRTMEEQAGERPIWLNTAGGGVRWLHVRLDTQPKYYRYRPYAAQER